MRFFLEIHNKAGKQMNGDCPEEIEATDMGLALEEVALRLPELLVWRGPIYEIHLWVAEP